MYEPSDVKDNIFREEEDSEPGVKFLSPHNVCAIAKTIHHLTTLSFPPDLDDKMREETTENLYYGEYAKQVFKSIQTSKEGEEYSEELLELIRNCLNIDIDQRPRLPQVS